MKKLLSMMLAAAMSAGVYADHTVFLDEVDNGGFQVGGNDVFTYDIKVDVFGLAGPNAPQPDAPDSWLVARVFEGTTGFLADNLLPGKSVYQDPFGTDIVPNPSFLGSFPSLQWDTFITNPFYYPNTNAAGPVTYVGGDFTETETVWATIPPGNDSGNGVFTLARFSIINGGNRAPLTLLPTGVVAGQLTIRTQTSANAGDPIPWTLTVYQVPEPSTLALVAATGLVVLGRRR